MTHSRFLRVNPFMFVTAACCCIVFPISWITAWLVSVVVHEVAHYLCIRACDGQVSFIRLGVTGMRMHANLDSPKKEVLCAAAGPVGSFALLLLRRWFPLVAIFGFIHGAYNLMPVYPADGGRILVFMLSDKPYGKKLQKYIEASTLFVVTVVGLIISLSFRLGMIPIIVIIYWIVRLLKKYLAKKRPRHYNMDNSTE